MTHADAPTPRELYHGPGYDYAETFDNYADAARAVARTPGMFMVKPSLYTWLVCNSWALVDQRMRGATGPWFYAFGDAPRRLRFDCESRDIEGADTWARKCRVIEGAFYQFLAERHADRFDVHGEGRDIADRRFRYAAVDAHRADKMSTHITSKFVFADHVQEYRCMEEFRGWATADGRYAYLVAIIDWGIYGLEPGASTLRMAGTAKDARGTGLLTSGPYEFWAGVDAIQMHLSFNPQFVTCALPLAAAWFPPSEREQDVWRREDEAQHRGEIEAEEVADIPEALHELTRYVRRRPCGDGLCIILTGTHSVTVLEVASIDIGETPWQRVWFRTACALQHVPGGGMPLFRRFVSLARPPVLEGARREKYDERYWRAPPAAHRPSAQYLQRMMCARESRLSIYTRNERGDVYLHRDRVVAGEGRFIGNLNWVNAEVIVDTPYVEYPAPENGILAIASPMGTGKTQYARGIVGTRRSGLRVLCITCRRTLARHLAQELELDLYIGMTPQQLVGARRLVVQFESLQKWAKQHARVSGALPVDAFDVLIIDEFVSLMMHLASDTMSSRRRVCMATLAHLLRHVPRVLGLDADLEPDGAPMDFVRNVAPGRSVVSVRNITLPRPLRTYTFMGYEALLLRLNDAVDEGVRIGLVCTNRALMHTIAESLRLRGAAGVATYSSESADEDIERDMASVDEAWRDMQVVAFTSTITVGVDYNGPPRLVFAVVDATSTDAQQVVQMTGRFRGATEVLVAFTKRNTNNRGDLHVPDQPAEVQESLERLLEQVAAQHVDFMDVDECGRVRAADTPLTRVLAWAIACKQRSRDNCMAAMKRHILAHGNRFVEHETLRQPGQGRELTQETQERCRQRRGTGMMEEGQLIADAPDNPDDARVGTAEHARSIFKSRVGLLLGLDLRTRDARWWAIVANSLPQLTNRRVLGASLDGRSGDALLTDLWAVFGDAGVRAGVHWADNPLMSLYIAHRRIDEPLGAASFTGAEVQAVASLLFEIGTGRPGLLPPVTGTERYTSDEYRALFIETMALHGDLAAKLNLQGDVRSGILTARNRASLMRKLAAYFGMEYRAGRVHDVCRPEYEAIVPPPHLSKLFG